jgi:cytochrome c oxidase subunit 4
MSRVIRTYLWTWIALLALLALTVGSSFVAMGRWNLVANLAIAGGKAVLVVLFFMELRKASTTTRVVAIGGLAWLAILVILAGADFAMR